MTADWRSVAEIDKRKHKYNWMWNVIERKMLILLPNPIVKWFYRGIFIAVLKINSFVNTMGEPSQRIASERECFSNGLWLARVSAPANEGKASSRWWSIQPANTYPDRFEMLLNIHFDHIPTLNTAAVPTRVRQTCTGTCLVAGRPIGCAQSSWLLGCTG